MKSFIPSGKQIATGLVITAISMAIISRVPRVRALVMGA